MELNEICKNLLESAFRIHEELGPGLEPEVYASALNYELMLNCLDVERDKDVKLIHGDETTDIGLKADIIIEDKVVVQVKSIENFNGEHQKEINTCARLLNCSKGFMINFNVEKLQDGVIVSVNDFKRVDVVG